MLFSDRDFTPETEVFGKVVANCLEGKVFTEFFAEFSKVGVVCACAEVLVLQQISMERIVAVSESKAACFVVCGYYYECLFRMQAHEVAGNADGVVHIDDYSMISNLKSNWVLQLVITLLVVLITGFLFNYTKIGKQAKAIGDNPISARQSGANVNGIRYFAYILAGLLVGIASIFLMARSGSIGKSIGSGMEMDIMIAIILGGMNLNGGSKSKMSAAVIGSITYRLLSNGMTMVGVKTNYISLVKGIIFLAIIFMTLRQSKNVKEMPR